LKKLEFGQAVTLLANIGVIAGIMILAIEIQQNTGEIRSQASLGINDSLARMNAAIYQDSELADILIRGRESLNNLDPVERERFRAFYLERVNLAVYVSNLERENTTDVHINYIGVVARIGLDRMSCMIDSGPGCNIHVRFWPEADVS
jgi:hypothetical protein